MTPIDKIERIKMVKAMEYIARQLNDEDIFMYWLEYGVADGDIKYSDLSTKLDDDYYLDDDNFTYLMDTFLKVMKAAYKSGGLYCGGRVTTIGDYQE